MARGQSDVGPRDMKVRGGWACVVLLFVLSIAGSEDIVIVGTAYHSAVSFGAMA